jgi:hypothetical protein
MCIRVVWPHTCHRCSKKFTTHNYECDLDPSDEKYALCSVNSKQILQEDSDDRICGTCVRQEAATMDDLAARFSVCFGSPGKTDSSSESPPGSTSRSTPEPAPVAKDVEMEPADIAEDVETKGADVENDIDMKEEIDMTEEDDILTPEIVMTDKEEETTDLELPPSDSMDIALSV